MIRARAAWCTRAGAAWLATRSRSTTARRWPRRRFIVETVAAHPPNSLEARQALASLAHEPWHVVRAGVLKA